MPNIVRLMSPSSLLGAAGEHYVMSQLLRRGLIAVLAPVGVPTADIVVTGDIGDRACAVQVKTRRQLGSDGGWHMKAKHECIRGASLFYVFLPDYSHLDLADNYGPAWLEPYRDAWNQLRADASGGLST